jgi:hypothetical protein
MTAADPDGQGLLLPYCDRIDDARMKTAVGGGRDDRIREVGWQWDGGDGRILDGLRR